MFERFLSEPRLRGIEIGSSEWYARQLSIISDRPLAKRTYDLWYRKLLDDARSVDERAAGGILEIGSGSGYAKTIDPSIITSDVVPGNADLLVDARTLPFGDATLRAILLTHVFHHIPDVEAFLTEALRVLVPGGVIAIIDVAHTPFSRLVFGTFHHEAYDHRVASWRLDESGPHNGANQALTWVVFERDRRIFEDRFPDLSIEVTERLPWLGYLLSGGVSKKNLIPPAVAPVIGFLDRAMEPAGAMFALHWHIRLRKIK